MALPASKEEERKESARNVGQINEIWRSWKLEQKDLLSAKFGDKYGNAGSSNADSNNAGGSNMNGSNAGSSNAGGSNAGGSNVRCRNMNGSDAGSDTNK